MQTFLPSASFADSAAVLDSPRLGKQRVETLQILRALVLPSYGWQRHPAVRMWRGHVPALTAYGLATIDQWRARGFADSTAEQVREFAPEVEGVPQQQLADDGLLPGWLGRSALHESHRSKLIEKDPERYAPLFPGTPRGMDYVWPVGLGRVETPAPDGLWVLRVDALATWRGSGLLGLALAAPRGTTASAWAAQVRAFEDALEPGSVLGVVADDEPQRLHLAEVTGPAGAASLDGVAHAAVAAHLDGSARDRAALPVPAVLQNPRRFFPTGLPVSGRPPSRGAEDSAR